MIIAVYGGNDAVKSGEKAAGGKKIGKDINTFAQAFTPVKAEPLLRSFEIAQDRFTGHRVFPDPDQNLRIRREIDIDPRTETDQTVAVASLVADRR